MNESLRLKIKRIMENHGTLIFSDFQKFKVCLDAEARDERKGECKAIEQCVKHGAYNALQTAVTPAERNTIKTALAQKIYAEEGMDRSFCTEALDILESVLISTTAGNPVCKSCGHDLDAAWILCPFCGLPQARQGIKNTLMIQIPQVNISGLSGQVVSFLKVVIAPFYYYVAAFRKCFVFEGRTRRAPFWCFIILDTVVSYIIPGVETATDYYYYNEIPWVSYLYMIAGIMPKISLCIRRMHDINKSGWHILCPLYNVILALLPGTKGDNKYGSPPG
jgi:uncharacterized membrane protein YhaH (DUF805 family)